jgi:hypothetical protein
MRRRWTVSLAMLVVLASVTFEAPPGRANGGKSKRVVYRGALAPRDATAQTVQLDAELEPLLFRLTAVGDTYRVVRIRIRNTGDRPLVLSAGADAIEAVFRGGPPVAGILDLAARDAGAWDRLPADLRSAIVYPRAVQAGEEESIFVFLPLAHPKDAPQGFRYRIASQPDRAVEIRDVSAAVAR